MPRHLLSKRILRLWPVGLALLVLALLVLYAPILQHGPSKIQLGSRISVAGHADTWTNIHPFLMFDYNITRPARVAPRYDFVAGGEWYNVAAYRPVNPNLFLTYYITLHRDDGTFKDSTALKSLAGWQAYHPDWVLYRCDRLTPAYEFGDPNMPLDFSNPALVNWQVQNYALPASQRGYQGIMVDNLNLENLYGACGTYQHGVWVQRYSGQYDDPVWQSDVVNWITSMQTALHNLPQPMALIPNFGFSAGLALTDPLIQGVLNHADGIIDEAGFTDFGNGDISDQDWTRAIQFREMVQAQGKPIYIINQFSVLNRAAIQWALSSYLMTKEHGCELFISGVQKYGSDVWYNEYNAQIGSPTDVMYQAQNVYLRDYTNGVSIVNPSATISYTVSLSPTVHYVDLYGKSAGAAITLGPHSGRVLLLAH